MARATAVEEQPLRELLQIGEKGPEASSLFWDGRSHIPRGNRKVPKKIERSRQTRQKLIAVAAAPITKFREATVL
jgi:hypothetical protein